MPLRVADKTAQDVKSMPMTSSAWTAAATHNADRVLQVRKRVRPTLDS
jgi:hypothetical protein